MRNWKFNLGLGLLILVVIFTIQNVEALQVNFLFWTFTMRRALLLFLVLAAGMLLGWGLHARSVHRHSTGAGAGASHGEGSDR